MNNDCLRQVNSQEPANTNTQLVNSGFHRSGTSMLAQMLCNAGVELGDNLAPPQPSNPDGHFEDFEIVQLHDTFLYTNQTDWKYTGPNNLSLLTNDRDKLRKLAAC